MKVQKKVQIHKSDSHASFNQVLAILRQNQGYGSVGATACFTGIARGTARDGKPLRGIIISVDTDTLEILEKISRDTEEQYDIVQQCAIHLNTGEIPTKNPIMFTMIAGTQTPECVPELFDIVVATLDRVKREAHIKLLEIPWEGKIYETKPKDPTKSFD